MTGARHRRHADGDFPALQPAALPASPARNVRARPDVINAASGLSRLHPFASRASNPDLLHSHPSNHRAIRFNYMFIRIFFFCFWPRGRAL